MADDFKIAQPHQYHRLFLRESIRPDGRAVTACRDIKLHVNSVSTALGSAMVCFGDTRVIAGIKGRFAEPDIARPGQGFLVPNVTLSALCNSKYRPGMPCDGAVAMSHRLASVLEKAVPREQLCIRKGRVAWCLYLDVVCLNDDGNVWDAVLLAASAALKSAVLPATQHVAETEVVAVDREVEGSRLQMSYTPVSVTLSGEDCFTPFQSLSSFYNRFTPLFFYSLSVSHHSISFPSPLHPIHSLPSI